MEQLLLHLLGDYILQTDWMASQKRKHWLPAFIHAFTYTLPFLLISHSLLVLFVIMATHFLIDHFGLARYVNFAKNWITDSSLKWHDCSVTGFRADKPAQLAIVLLIVVDNTMHLLINYAALRWL